MILCVDWCSCLVGFPVYLEVFVVSCFVSAFDW